jgi:hypothetical protein
MDEGLEAEEAHLGEHPSVSLDQPDVGP